MSKHLHLILAFSFLFIAGFTAQAQNCSVNAGINTTICPGQSFTLRGTATGLFDAPGSEPVWSQISGPSVTVSSTTFSGGEATAAISGYAVNVPYTFRLTGKCKDGSLVYQDVVYKVSDLSAVDAGPDAIACPGTPYTMQATPLAPGETGVWTRISGSADMPVPSPANSPTAVLNVNTSASVQTATYRWTVTKGDCSSFSDVVITNLGTETVDAHRSDDDNIIALNCYNVTTDMQLNASYAANHAASGQSGKWSFISGPSVPVFSNVNARNSTVSNLIQGTYILRWIVTGPCQNGFSDLTINVAQASQDITDAGGYTEVYCDGRTSVVLKGPKALYPEESVVWTKTSGPGTPVIADPNSNITTVTGLTAAAGTNYTFQYKITNSVTGCESTGAYHIRYVAPPTVTITSSNPLVADCGAVNAVINYNTTGGTHTEYALISAPAGSALETSLGGLNNFVPAPSSGSTINNFDKPGTYVLRYKRYSKDGVGGCFEGYADVTVITSQPPTSSNAGTRQVLACNVFNTNLAGNLPASGTGKWSQVSGPNTAVIADPLAFNTGISGLISGVYKFRWIISGGEGNCQNSQSDVEVVVSTPTPTTSAAGDAQNVCNSTPVQLDGNQPAVNETGTWTVNPAAGVVFSDINDPKAIANGLTPNTVYTFTWTITNPCNNTSASSVSITTNNIEGPKQAAAGPDQCLPAGTASFTLAGNAPSAGETGTWTLLPGAPNTPAFTAGQYNASVTGTVNGTYLFEWKLDRNGCNPTRDTVMITISAPATAANAGADQNICGNSVTLAGSNPTIGTGKWTQVGGAGGAVIADPSLRNTTVTGLTDGRYVFRWTISNNACASNFDEVTINVSTPPTTADAGPDQAVCDNTTATLAANTIAVGTGMWSVVNGPSTPSFSNVNDPAATVSNLKYGTYTFRWTSRNGAFCTPSTDDVVISVTQNALAGADQSLCNTNTITLRGNEGSTGTWTRTSGPNMPTITANGTNGAIISGLAAGTYVFRYTIPAVGACPETFDEINVTISAPPSAADAGADQAVCQPTADDVSTMTMAAVTPLVGTGTWTLLDRTAGTAAPTITTPNSPTTTITGMEPGVYLYEWRVASGSCTGANSNADIVRLTVYKEPSDANAGPDQNNACNQNVVMAATAPEIGLGTWNVVAQPGGSPAVSFVAVNSPTTQVDNLVEGTYVFEWTVSNGSPTCTPKTDQVQVIVTSTPPTVADAGAESVDICNTATTASYTLGGNAPSASETGTWSIISQPSGSAANFVNANSNTSAINGLIAGTYTLRWTIVSSTDNSSTDCMSSDDIILTVYNEPSEADAGADQTVCQFTQVTLDAAPVAAGRGIGTWSVVSKSVPSSPNPVFADINDPKSTLTGLLPGVYTLRWTTSNGSCTSKTDDVVITVSQCEIAVAKSASTPVLQSDGSYNITFTFKVKNTGNTALSNVQVVDDLTSTFPAPKTYTVTSIAAGGPSLTANTDFNGNADKNLLTAASSSLAAGAEETITVTVNVKLN